MTTLAPTRVFDRVVCGVDRSEPALVAARAAAIVTDAAGSLSLVSADNSSVAVHAAWKLVEVREAFAADAAAALEQATAAAQPIHELTGKVVRGDRLHVLLAEIERQQATLLVVGTHGHARSIGIAAGSVATFALHEAPCSVLVARGNVEAGRWPSRIVVGLDGSEDSAIAYRAAAELADRTGATLQAIVATRDRGIDLEAVRAIAPQVDERDARALDLLSVLSRPSDLLVVGSRGMKGVRALGSLSERLAHESRSSVLVVRPRA